MKFLEWIKDKHNLYILLTPISFILLFMYVGSEIVIGAIWGIIVTAFYVELFVK